MSTRTFSWEDPALHRAAAAGKSGLAFLQAILAGEVPQAPISHALGYLLVGAEEGVAAASEAATARAASARAT